MARDTIIVGAKQFKVVQLHVFPLKLQKKRDGHLAMFVIKTNFMKRYDHQEILQTVYRLKEIKDASFVGNDGKIDFSRVTENCRIADVFSLPLFYIWEHQFKRDLKELGFENHLQKAYNKFQKDPQTNTWLLYLFISIDTPLFQGREGKALSRDISKIYRDFAKSNNW